MNKNKNKLKKVAAAVVAVATVVMLAALLWSASDLVLATKIADAWRLGTPGWAMVWTFVLTIVGVIASVAVALESTSDRNQRFAAVAAVAVLAGGALAIGHPDGPVRQATRSAFDATKSYLAAFETAQGERPGYQPRLNAPQAEARLTVSITDSSVSDMSAAQYAVADGEPAWCVGLYGRSRVSGLADRVYAKGVACLVESTDKVVRVDWPSGVRVPTYPGAFSTNLQKYVARLQRGVSVADRDVRFYIEGGQPSMLAPVTRIAGPAMEPRRVPAGFVTVDETGELTYRREAKPGEWPVPVISYGVAEKVRAALNTRAGFWCMDRLSNAKCVERNQALEDTSSLGGTSAPSSDPNAANPTEFVLRRESDGRLVMVTPLTTYGKARNVTAYLEVEVDEVVDGQMPSARLFDVIPEASHLSVAQAVTAAYTADISWLSEVNAAGDTAAASRIYEITPRGPGQVALTVGNGTNPQYEVLADVVLTDGSLQFDFCIFDFKSGKKLDCRSSTDLPAELGTLRGIAGLDTGDGPAVDVGSGFDVSSLSDEELVGLINEAARELAGRGGR